MVLADYGVLVAAADRVDRTVGVSEKRLSHQELGADATRSSKLGTT